MLHGIVPMTGWSTPFRHWWGVPFLNERVDDPGRE